MSGITEGSLAQSILEGLESEGFQNLNNYLDKLARGIAKGIYKELTIHAEDDPDVLHICPAVDIYTGV